MARARNIKPGFFKNDLLAECNPLARLLFAGLWCEADRDGRLEDRPKRLKAEYLPYDDCDIEQLLADLVRRGFILRYQVGGSAYIAVPQFAKHQNPHVREPASSIPAPDENSASTVQAPDDHRTGPADSPSLIPDSPSLRSGGAEPPAAQPPAITLPLNTGDEFPITADQVREFTDLYPAADVIAELRKMRGWLIANPANRKTKSGVLRFVTRWLGKEQDKGAPAMARAGPNGQQPPGKMAQGVMALEEMKNEVRRRMAAAGNPDRPAEAFTALAGPHASR